MNIFRKAIKNLHPAAPLRAAAAAVFVSLAIPLSAQLKAAPEPLITDPTKVQVGANKWGVDRSNVVSITTYNAGGIGINDFATTPITVDFTGNPVQLSETRGLVIYFGRYSNSGAPTVVKVSGHNVATGGEDVLGYAYLLFRGGGRTHEFSNPVYGNGSYDSFKLEILEVSSGDSAEFYKFNLFAIEDGQSYPAGRIDPLHLPTDYYRYTFKDFTYEPNSGILDRRNHYGYNKDYPEETPWGEDNTFVYDGEVHELPTFHKQGGGQMPHVTEQTLYAMPGDIISLSPYYDLPTSGNYREKFSHWYGYNPRNSRDELQEQDYHHITDSNGNRLLDFLIDPSGIVLTEKSGYYGGTAFPRTDGDNYLLDENGNYRLGENGERIFVISNSDSFNRFAEIVHSGQVGLNAILANDIDCAGKAMQKIAGDYVQELGNIVYHGKFDGNGHTIWNYNFYEPETSYHSGIFGGIDGGAEICNLIVRNANIRAGGKTGVLVGAVYSTDRNNLPIYIHNVYVTGTSEYTAKRDIIIQGTPNTRVQLSQGGGIIGGIDWTNNEITVNLEDVTFIGTVKGGTDYLEVDLGGNVVDENGKAKLGDIFNGAFVGTSNNNTINLTNCYADAFVENVKTYHDNDNNVRRLHGIGAVGNYAWYQQCNVDNSYINVKTNTYDTNGQHINIGVPVSLVQDNFASWDFPKAIITTDQTPIKQNEHIICINLPADWQTTNPNPTIYAYKGPEGTAEEAFGKWNTTKLTIRDYAGYVTVNDETWNKFKQGGWKFIVYKGDGDAKNQTLDYDLIVGDNNDLFYDNIGPKSQGDNNTWTGPQAQVSNSRTILVKNDNQNRRYRLYAVSNEGTNYSLPQNGWVPSDEGGYSFFNLPSNWGDINFCVAPDENNTSAQFFTGFDKTLTYVYPDTNDFYKDILSEEFITNNAAEWVSSVDGTLVPPMEIDDTLNNLEIENAEISKDLRWYGTEATFYQPRDGKAAPDDDKNLSLEKPEYHIAADFGHEFNPDGKEYNVDRDEKIIHEPILNFRHIFHIKDGRKFADDNTATKEQNATYLKNNSRAVSARANMDFQIRLTTQIPSYTGNSTYSFTKTNFYYKKAEREYARVPRVALEIIDPEGNVTYSEFRDATAQTVNKGIFFFDATANTQGVRKYPDSQSGFCADGNTDMTNTDYQGGNGNSSVYRTLFCKAENAKPGVYKICLMAMESDGITKIMTTDGEAPLYLDEYVVTFIPGSDASVLTETDLNKDDYYTHTTEYLEQEDVAGLPAVVVDFDQYRTFEEAPYVSDDYFRHHGDGPSDRRSYKWPVLWQKSTYSFGYGGYYEYDFNEYIIANHSDEVMYHAAADNHSNPDNTTGLFDRLYYDTYAANPENPQKGYFYYTNAASDPGVAARLTINNLCPGSTVAVSAWVAEFSYENEVANLSFNFVAVDGDGNREIVHSFVTGYIDNVNFGSQKARADYDKGSQEQLPNNENMKKHGQWMHVYYSFIPDLSSVNNLVDIDHYELELENNCVSSIGADYAVDDIRAYIISPQITARQLNPVCDANQNTVGIRISSRFDKLLDSNGLVESTEANGIPEETLTLHFAVLDKKKYDKAYEEALAGNESHLTSEELSSIVKSSIIAMNETTDDEVDKIYFTPVEISTDFSKMPPYEESVFGTAQSYKSETSGVRYIRTNILPYDTDLRPGKDYYIVLYAQFQNSDGTTLPDPTFADFAITDDPCAKYAVMTLQGSGVIKIDGIAYNDGEPIDVCEGQSPVVQVDLKMLHDDKEIDMPAYNDYDNAPAHYYDWFVGPVDEFMATPENGGSSYYDLLYLFRNGETPGGESTPSGKGNIDADHLPDPVDGEEDRYAPLRQLIKEGRLVLHASSFVFPPLKNTDEAGNIHVLTAMPIIPGPDDEEGYKVCSQPNEIRLRVQNNSPLMFDGFTGIDYPEADVPVRVGLSQLRSVRELGALTIEDRTGNRLGLIPNVTIPENLRKLEIPLRGLLSYKGEDVAAEMTMAGNRNEAADPYVYLVETDDPAYISLDKHPMDEMPIRNSLLPIGMVDNLSAKTTEDGKNNVTILFDENMQFAEGYYYRVRFAFDEVIPTEVEGYCEGHVVFTIKVVPEYQKWTGADSRNWNNDANWSRVTADDILLPAGDAKTDDFTVIQKRSRIPLIVDADGNVTPKPEKLLPSNRRSYAPLDFTKVLVSKMANDTTTGYPYMFAATEEKIMTLHDEMSWNNRALPAEILTMEPTENIEYDMVSLDLKDGPLAMRPWYANTCEQIHFNHGAEMAHQESFIFEKNYQKAWVNMEMTGDRWYTLASPLQGVVAGDMYTKTAGGKQDNELFTDITFNNDDYGRYEPAVYQRGWNKAEAKTYLLGDDSHASKSAAVQLNWSRVYNDVEEAYAPGLGFSIRTATDGITAADKDDNDKVTVRFRLPKADDSYSYFDKDDNTEGADDTTVGRTGNRHALTAFGDDGKLKVNLTVGTDGTYFLAGNPFMARMKMAEFLAANADVIESAYWIMTDDRQEAALWDEKSGTFISTDKTEATDGTIAPMQGFFVKAKEKRSLLTLTFTPAMIDDGEIDNSVILRAPRADRRQLLTISAIDAEGETASRALIKLDAEASATFEPSEDVTLLIDRTLEEHPSVYTVASGQALAINSLDAIVETEVGLLANEESAHTLLFEGVDESEGLRLLDTVTGEISDLYDGMEIEVKGAAAGRYYIVRPSDMMEEVTMAILLKERTVSVVAETAGITARVYTPDGLCSGEWSTADSLLHFDLEPGIFIVEAMADGRRMMRKFIVR